MSLTLRSLAVPAAWALSMVLAAPALAALGGNADSVTADHNALRGQLVATPMVDYDAQEITTGATIVREYVTRSGQVFALTWEGPTLPNLQQLLGSYFGRFQSAADNARRTNPGIHRRFSLNQSDLVVISTGRMRSFRGIAYLPALIPTGVTVGELQ